MVEVRSRTERRSDKKQSFVLIAFLVTVAIVCFASGFMVGRNTASGPTGAQVAVSGTKKPVTSKPITAKPVEEKKEEKLTFYEALPKGEQPPLGSGINLPPQEQKPEPAVVQQVAVAPDTVKPAIPEKVFEPAEEDPAPKPAPAVKEKPKVDPETVKYVLQVASFPQPDEAGEG
jgi:hypothetical protein